MKWEWVLIAAVLAFSVIITGTASADDVWFLWYGDAGDSLWTNPWNWDMMDVPQANQTPPEDARIEHVLAPLTGPVIQAGDVVGTGALTLGVWLPGLPYAELTMTGGSFTISGWWALGDKAGAYGKMTVTNGSINATSGPLTVGMSGVGLLIVGDPTYSGSPSIRVRGSGIVVGRDNSASGTILLYNGTLRGQSLNMIGAAGSTSLLNIEKGTLQVDGNVITNLTNFIAQNRIQSYGNRGDFNNLSYNSGTRITTLTAGEPNWAIAWNPMPRYTEGYYAEGAAAPDANLTWSAGLYASSHNVYLGTSLADVNNATDPNVYPGRGNTTATSFNGNLAFNQTYYWRIDEVNDTTLQVWKGRVWSFTTADYVMLDNFETYADTTGMLGNWRADSNTVLTLSQGGGQHYIGTKAMECNYISGPAEIDFNSPTKNWTRNGINAFSISFYGATANGHDKTMHVAIKDENNHVSPTLTYANDINNPAWLRWNIEIADFNDGVIDLTKIKNIIITLTGSGSGLVYFDNIFISPSRCFPEYAIGDFTGNCTAEFDDFDMMANAWLATDSTLYAQTPDSNQLVAWYKLDEGGGTTASDSSGNGYDGTTSADPVWVAGYTGSALSFRGQFGSADYVACGTFDPTALGTPGQMSVTYWVKWNGYNGRYQSFIAKRFEWDQTNWVWHVGMGPAADTVFFWTGDGNDVWLGAPPPVGVWTHVAITTDGTILRMYYNGVLQISGPYTLGSGTTTTPVRFGSTNAFDGLNGVMDDVRFYGYALSQAEILSVMGTSALYNPITSPANLYNAEPINSRIINFRDLAIFSSHWRELQLWP